MKKIQVLKSFVKLSSSYIISKFIYSNIYLFISIYLINSFDRWMVSHCGSIYAVHHREHTQESNGQNTGGKEVLKSRSKGTRISRDYLALLEEMKECNILSKYNTICTINIYFIGRYICRDGLIRNK